MKTFVWKLSYGSQLHPRYRTQTNDCSHGWQKHTQKVGTVITPSLLWFNCHVAFCPLFCPFRTKWWKLFQVHLRYFYHRAQVFFKSHESSLLSSLFFFTSFLSEIEFFFKKIKLSVYNGLMFKYRFRKTISSHGKCTFPVTLME